MERQGITASLGSAMDPVFWAETAIVSLVLVLGGAIAVVWAVRRAEHRVADFLQKTSAIITHALSAANSYRALDGMAESIAELFDADACVVALPTGDGRLFCGPAHGYPDPDDLFVQEYEGITGATYVGGEPIVVHDVTSDPRYVHTVPGMRYAISVPLSFEGKVVGVFELESKSRKYTERDLRLLLPLGDQIASAIEHLKLRVAAEERAENEARVARDLHAISSVVLAGVASSSDLDTTMQSMIKEIGFQLGWESMAVILYGEDGLLHTKAFYGYPIHSTLITFEPGKGIVGAVAESGRGRLVKNVDDDPDYIGVVSGTSTEMCVPLIAGERCLGVLNAESPRPGAFTEEDFVLMGTLARQMALVIEQARLGDLEREALISLKEADRLKDDFVATVSHELRTPLTSIKGYANTLLARDVALTTRDRTAFLQIMVKQCDRLASIVDTLLLASRLETGEVEPQMSYFLFTELLQDAAEVSDGQDRIQLEVASGVGAVADRFRVHHIVRNLMENACKYSPTASPVLARAHLKGEEIWVEVLDQGPGIPEGQEERIFERFQRLSEPGHAIAPGTGLGLFIARRFARDLDGDLSVQRAAEGPWSGAHFTLRIPIAPEHLRETVEARGINL